LFELLFWVVYVVLEMMGEMVVDLVEEKILFFSVWLPIETVDCFI
jgi:hypothetical protein